MFTGITTCTVQVPGKIIMRDTACHGNSVIPDVFVEYSVFKMPLFDITHEGAVLGQHTTKGIRLRDLEAIQASLDHSLTKSMNHWGKT